MARKPFSMPPKAFGPAEGDPNANVTVFTADDAPAPRQGTPPAITRKLEGDGEHLILLTFTPAQVLRSHHSAPANTAGTLQGSVAVHCGCRDSHVAQCRVAPARAV